MPTTPEASEGAAPLVRLIAGSPLDTINEDYGTGEITAVYDRMASERCLLFAAIELLPKNLEAAPDDLEPRCQRLGGNSDHEVNILRWHASPEEAVAWCGAAANGLAQLPGWKSQPESHPLKIGRLASEPPWPSFTFESEPFWGSTPLWGNRPGGSRISQFLCVGEKPGPYQWTETERERARDWLRENLPIDLFARPVLWGSLNLILPNPLFCRISERLTSEDGNRVALELVPYPGKSLEGLQVVVREHRPAGAAIVSVHELPSSRVLLDFPHEVHLLEIAILCPRRGLLFSSKPAVFIRQILLQYDLIAGQRDVIVPSRSRRRKQERHSTQIKSPDRTTAVGDRPVRGGLDIALQDRLDLRQSKDADIGFRWFNGDIDAATTFIRGLIAKARQRVTIVDAYLDRRELGLFALANATRGVVVRILTSKMFLRDGTERGRTRQREKDFLAALDSICAQDHTTAIEVRVMGGEKAGIHDRFLMLDEELWLLGSSLNEFGDRGSTAIRLPYAPNVGKDIEQEWAKAQPLAEFMASESSEREPK